MPVSLLKKVAAIFKTKRNFRPVIKSVSIKKMATQGSCFRFLAPPSPPRKISSSRFALEKNFELDLCASLPMVESGHEPVLSYPNLSP